MCSYLRGTLELGVSSKKGVNEYLAWLAQQLMPVALYNYKNDQHPLIDHEHSSCCSLVCTKMQK